MSTTIDISKYTGHLRNGKFEGESNGATEYFYELMANGDGESVCVSDDFEREELGLYGDIFFVNADEAEAFGLGIGKCFLLRGDSQGFAYGSEHDSRAEAEEYFAAWVS